MAEEIKTKTNRKQDSNIYCLQKTHLSFKNTLSLKVKDGKRYPKQMETRRKEG